MATQPTPGRRPGLARLTDGRYVVRCVACEQGKGENLPIGIGMPIANQFEAESIIRNHGGWAATSPADR